MLLSDTNKGDLFAKYFIRLSTFGYEIFEIEYNLTIDICGVRFNTG